ncbi:MAG: hypothetical protein ACK55I_37790, partial [bacterium]
PLTMVSGSFRRARTGSCAPAWFLASDEVAHCVKRVNVNTREAREVFEGDSDASAALLLLQKNMKTLHRALTR